MEDKKRKIAEKIEEVGISKRRCLSCNLLFLCCNHYEDQLCRYCKLLDKKCFCKICKYFFKKRKIEKMEFEVRKSDFYNFEKEQPSLTSLWCEEEEEEEDEFEDPPTPPTPQIHHQPPPPPPGAGAGTNVLPCQ